MDHYPLLTTLATGFTGAWALGLITQRVGLSPIVGYLVAGTLLGPHTPGFVADVTLAPQLAELGVILLMFGVGLHFHLKDLLAVRSIAIPGALIQSAAATIAGVVIFKMFGWPMGAGLVVGMAMAVASTVVLIRMLVDNRMLNSPAGHAAVGWLIVEDIFTVLILVIIPALAGAAAPPTATAEAHAAGGHWLVAVGVALGKLAAMILVLYVAGSRLMPWALVKVAGLRSRELFTLTVLVFSIAIATGAAALFGVSVALGAFIAGMVVAQSPVSQQAGIEALPLRDAFAVLFFVAVGMLFDPLFLIKEPLLILAGLVIVLIIKPLTAALVIGLLGFQARVAITVAVGLAQIGEFSFILGDIARKHGLISEAAGHLLVACALVSITLNPVLFRLIGPIEKWLMARPKLWRLVNGRSEGRAGRLNAPSIERIAAAQGRLAVIVGHGPVGRQVDNLLRQAGLETIIIDLNMDTVSELLNQGRTALYGDASRAELLEQAGVGKASHLVLTMPQTPDQQALITAARDLNPAIRLITRTRYLHESAAALRFGADEAVVDEVEAAVALTRLVLAESNADASSVRAEISRLRAELAPDTTPA